MSQMFESERLRAIIETVVDGIITISDTGIIETVNPATEKIFGYSAKEMVGQNVCMLMPEPYSSEHNRYISNFLLTRVAKIIGTGRELIGRRKNGSTFAMELAVNEMNVANQRKFTGIVRDISERKLSELALKSSEQRIRAIVDTVTDTIITINDHGIILSVNKATEKTFGYADTELLGQNISQLMPEPYKTQHQHYVQNYLFTGDAKILGISRELIGQHKDGSTFPIELSVNEARVDNQRLFIGVIRNIAERKTHDLAIRSRENRLGAILQTVVDGIITIDEKGKIKTVNPAAESIFGYSSQKMIGRNVSMLMPEPYHSSHDQYLINFLGSGNAKIIGIGREITGRRSDGSEFPMELAVSEMYVDNQRMFTGIVRDISMRKSIENALRSGEAKLRAVFDTVLDSIITINKNGLIETINPAAEKLFGYMSHELIGKNIKMLMPEPYISEHDFYLQNYFKTGNKKVIGQGREVVGKRKDGTTFPMELAVNEMQIDGEKMFTGVVRDISERKRTEKLRQEFIATVSHELRTPLTSIKGALGLLNSEKILEDKATLRNLLNIAQSNTARLLYLINDLLDFQKIQAGKMEYQSEEIDLIELISNTVEECKHYGLSRKIEIKITRLLISQIIIGDKFRLAQVLANLLSNAIKFSPENGIVEVAAIEATEYIKISVKDYGRGISEEFKSRIFTEFSQSDPSSTRDIPGTGLGLSISKAIVEHHGGNIYFESEAGKGATFFVNLLKTDYLAASNFQ